MVLGNTHGAGVTGREILILMPASNIELGPVLPSSFVPFPSGGAVYHWHSSLYMIGNWSLSYVPFAFVFGQGLGAGNFTNYFNSTSSSHNLRFLVQ